MLGLDVFPLIRLDFFEDLIYIRYLLYLLTSHLLLLLTKFLRGPLRILAESESSISLHRSLVCSLAHANPQRAVPDQERGESREDFGINL